MASNVNLDFFKDSYPIFILDYFRNIDWTEIGFSEYPNEVDIREFLSLAYGDSFKVNNSLSQEAIFLAENFYQNNKKKIVMDRCLRNQAKLSNEISNLKELYSKEEISYEEIIDLFNKCLDKFSSLKAKFETSEKLFEARISK